MWQKSCLLFLTLPHKISIFNSLNILYGKCLRTILLLESRDKRVTCSESTRVLCKFRFINNFFLQVSV